MSRHNFEMVEVQRICLDTEQHGRVASALEPHMRDKAELNEAICEIEKVLTSVSAAQAHGLGKKPERIADSVRDELEEITAIGQRLLEIGRSPSDDARWFLAKTDRDNRNEEAPIRDGFYFILQSGARLKRWGRAALEELNTEGQPTISPGPAYRGDMLAGGAGLADIWIKYTGKGLSHNNRDWDAGSQRGGPWPAFLRASLKVIDPYFEANKLARQIYESRVQEEHGTS